MSGRQKLRLGFNRYRRRLGQLFVPIVIHSRYMKCILCAIIKPVNGSNVCSFRNLGGQRLGTVFVHDIYICLFVGRINRRLPADKHLAVTPFCGQIRNNRSLVQLIDVNCICAGYIRINVGSNRNINR
ncbi:hypothetical protein D3C84_974590 [compost metagenome]